MQLTPGALGASLAVLGLTAGCAPLVPAPGAGAPAAGPDAALWVYGTNRWTPDEQQAHLARFATMAGRLYPDQVYDAPLVPFVEGRVVDARGIPVAGARLRAAGHEVDTNRCGGFGLKGLPVEGIDLEVTARGYVPARVTVGRLVPGRVRELPPVRLERIP